MLAVVTFFAAYQLTSLENSQLMATTIGTNISTAGTLTVGPSGITFADLTTLTTAPTAASSNEILQSFTVGATSSAIAIGDVVGYASGYIYKGYGDTNGNPIGIAKTAGSAGDSVNVILNGISDVHSGLTAGALYYGNTNGSIGTAVTSAILGRAVSTTKIWLRSTLVDSWQ